MNGNLGENVTVVSEKQPEEEVRGLEEHKKRLEKKFNATLETPDDWQSLADRLGVPIEVLGVRADELSVLLASLEASPLSS